MCHASFLCAAMFSLRIMISCLMSLGKLQGSRLTFQLASPVASDRFDQVAKINFSLARHLNIHCRIKSSIMQYGP